MQTAYNQYMAAGLPGLIADVQFQNNVESKDLETATATPGIVVSRGTDKARQVVVGGTSPLGILVRDGAHENNASGNLVYAAKETVGVITAGKVYVNIANTGNPGDAIFYTNATGVISVGTASTGQTQLRGCLDSLVSTPGALGVVKLLEQAAPIVISPARPVVITEDPADDTVEDGDTVTLSVVATGEPTITYQWEVSEDTGVNWAEIDGEDADELSFTAAIADTGFEYRCKVGNGYGFQMSAAATITVTAGT